VPHFEKMLYDQALLAACYLRADRAAGGKTPWRDVAMDTIAFVLRDLTVADGLASSLDADSGGVEGAHVVWSADEVEVTLVAAGLGDDVDAARHRWSIFAPGNFEGRCIPVLAPDEPFATPRELEAARRALLTSRQTRTQPGRDTKVVLEWNAMFLVALFESDDAELIHEGRSRLASLHRTHFDERVWWRTESRSAHATAADLAWLIEAHVSCFEASGDDADLTAVPAIIDYLMAHHWDGDRPRAAEIGEGGGLYMTSDLADELVIRPKEIFDGATPSAHAVAAAALARYAMIAGDRDSAAASQRLIDLAGPLLDEHPSAVPELVRAFGYVVNGREVVIPGERHELASAVRKWFVPHSVLVTGSGNSPLLAHREAGSAYVCRHGACSLPVNSVDALFDQLFGAQ